MKSPVRTLPAVRARPPPPPVTYRARTKRVTSPSQPRQRQHRGLVSPDEIIAEQEAEAAAERAAQAGTESQSEQQPKQESPASVWERFAFSSAPAPPNITGGAQL